MAYMQNHITWDDRDSDSDGGTDVGWSIAANVMRGCLSGTQREDFDRRLNAMHQDDSQGTEVESFFESGGSAVGSEHQVTGKAQDGNERLDQLADENQGQDGILDATLKRTERLKESEILTPGSRNTSLNRGALNSGTTHSIGKDTSVGLPVDSSFFSKRRRISDDDAGARAWRAVMGDDEEPSHESEPRLGPTPKNTPDEKHNCTQDEPEEDDKRKIGKSSTPKVSTPVLTRVFDQDRGGDPQLNAQVNAESRAHLAGAQGAGHVPRENFSNVGYQHPPYLKKMKQPQQIQGSMQNQQMQGSMQNQQMQGSMQNQQMQGSMQNEQMQGSMQNQQMQGSMRNQQMQSLQKNMQNHQNVPRNLQFQQNVGNANHQNHKGMQGVQTVLQNQKGMPQNIQSQTGMPQNQMCVQSLSNMTNQDGISITQSMQQRAQFHQIMDSNQHFSVGGKGMQQTFQAPQQMKPQSGTNQQQSMQTQMKDQPHMQHQQQLNSQMQPQTKSEPSTQQQFQPQNSQLPQQFQPHNGQAQMQERMMPPKMQQPIPQPRPKLQVFGTSSSSSAEPFQVSPRAPVIAVNQGVTPQNPGRPNQHPQTPGFPQQTTTTFGFQLQQQQVAPGMTQQQRQNTPGFNNQQRQTPGFGNQNASGFCNRPQNAPDVLQTSSAPGFPQSSVPVMAMQAGKPNNEQQYSGMNQPPGTMANASRNMAKPQPQNVNPQQNPMSNMVMGNQSIPILKTAEEKAAEKAEADIARAFFKRLYDTKRIVNAEDDAAIYLLSIGDYGATRYILQSQEMQIPEGESRTKHYYVPGSSYFPHLSRTDTNPNQRASNQRASSGTDEKTIMKSLTNTFTREGLVHGIDNILECEANGIIKESDRPQIPENALKIVSVGVHDPPPGNKVPQLDITRIYRTICSFFGQSAVQSVAVAVLFFGSWNALRLAPPQCIISDQGWKFRTNFGRSMAAASNRGVSQEMWHHAYISILKEDFHKKFPPYNLLAAVLRELVS